MTTAMIRTDKETLKKLQEMAPEGNVSRFLRELSREETLETNVEKEIKALRAEIQETLAIMEGTPVVMAAMLRKLDEDYPELRTFGCYEKNDAGKWIYNQELHEQMIKEDEVEKRKAKVSK